jgi:hypothetical protein
MENKAFEIILSLVAAVPAVYWRGVYPKIQTSQCVY